MIIPMYHDFDTDCEMVKPQLWDDKIVECNDRQVRALTLKDASDFY